VRPLLSAQRLGDELPAARIAAESRPPAAAVQTTPIGGWRSAADDDRRLRPVSSIALLCRCLPPLHYDRDSQPRTWSSEII
jgi:hypothetical protein